MDHTHKSIFLDIDGTLIPQGLYEARREDIEQIEIFHKAGHRFFLSTGRSLVNIPAALLNAPWLDGVVAGSGAHVLLRENDGSFKTIRRCFIPPATLCAICDYYLKTRVWCLFEGETAIYALNQPSAIVPPIVKTFPVERAGDFVTKYEGTKISKLTMGGDLAGEEKEILGGTLDFYAQKGYHEGIIKGESKSKGMGIILEALGLRREQSIAIGDSANDLDMIRFAGTGIAMGNACDELKAAAGYITGDVENGGVAQALRRYL
jgi:Cof subfamily protein (haloacid dehalogenase superfamily)